MPFWQGIRVRRSFCSAVSDQFADTGEKSFGLTLQSIDGNSPAPL
jgi:hypothetical protein